MARIRTIKPETPLSESLGRLSRDARLCFILLWTIVDDAGRARAASRMLASLLFPYDDDAPGLMSLWLDELAAEGVIRLYTIDGDHYLDIPKWLKHQKIDKPTASKLPEFADSSRGLARAPEPRGRAGALRGLDLDLGPGPRKGASDAAHQMSSAPTKRSIEDAFAAFNQVAEQIGIPTAAKLTPERRSKIAARIKEHGEEGWQRALDKLVESPFLRGENDRHWRADIDFVVRPGKFTKLIEGGYDRHGAAQSDMLAEVMRQVSEEIDNAVEGSVSPSQRPHPRANGAHLAAPAPPENPRTTRGLDEGVHHGNRRARPDRA